MTRIPISAVGLKGLTTLAAVVVLVVGDNRVLRLFLSADVAGDE